MLRSPHARSLARRGRRAATKIRYWSAALSLVSLVAGLAGPAPAVEPRAHGTGFLVRPDGWIITAAQLAAGARSLAVTCPGRPKAIAVVDQLVPRLDLAVLRIPQESLPYLSLNLSISVSEMVLVGENVAVVVYLNSAGAKLEQVPALATVTGLAGPGGTPEFFQLAMPADRRDPGGPVVTHRGDVVGILTTPEAIRRHVDPATPPSPAVTWSVKAQAARPLFIAPAPLPATRSLDDAIERTRQATCLIEIAR